MRKRTAAGALLVVLLSTSAAWGGPASGALLVGYGFNEGYRLGVGLRGGITLTKHLYLGGTLILHEGWTGVRIEQYERPQTDLYYGGAEAGWHVVSGVLVVRPYLGVGYALARASTTAGCVAVDTCVHVGSNDGALGLWPGVVTLASLGGVFVGADVRYVMLVGSAYENAFSAFGTAGLEF